MALMLVSGVAISLGGDRLPEVPVIGTDATETVVHLRWGTPSTWGDPDPTPEEAVAALQEDPAVDDVRLFPTDEVRELARGEGDEGLDALPDDAFAPVVEVRLDTDEALLHVVWRFHELVPTATISPASLQVASARMRSGDGYPGVDPWAATGDRTTAATFDDLDLEVWPVERGGVCYELDGMVHCHVNSLAVDGGSRSMGAWGRLEDGGVCVWGTTGVRVDEVVVTFEEGSQVVARRGSIPDLLLGQAFIACIDGDTYPVQIEASGAQTDTADTAGERQSVFDEVARDGPEARQRLVQHLHEGLDEDALRAALGAGSPTALRSAAETLREDIEAAGIPSGFDSLRVVDAGVTTADDRRAYVYAVVEATGASDPPRCLDVRLDVDGGDDALWLSERVWTRGACPTP